MRISLGKKSKQSFQKSVFLLKYNPEWYKLPDGIAGNFEVVLTYGIIHCIACLNGLLAPLGCSQL